MEAFERAQALLNRDESLDELPPMPPLAPRAGRRGDGFVGVVSTGGIRSAAAGVVGARSVPIMSDLMGCFTLVEFAVCVALNVSLASATTESW